jgi:hypothetical protein
MSEQKKEPPSIWDFLLGLAVVSAVLVFASFAIATVAVLIAKFSSWLYHL